MKNKTDRLAGNAERNPDYVYEENPPEVWEIQCPESQYFSCKEWMDRAELLAHYKEVHSVYSGVTPEDIEIHFEQERERKYGR